MATVTHYGSEQRFIGRDPVTLMFDVAFASDPDAEADDAAVTVELRDMPADTIYLWAQIQCLVADVGAGNMTLSLTHGSTSIYTGSTDNLGTVNTIDGGTAASDGAFLAAAANTAGATAGALKAVLARASGTSTTAPTARIVVHCMRSNVPS